MTLIQLKYALAVAQYKSINEAAGALFVTQPAISNAIKELETEFGISIFNRSNHGMDVTAEGIEFLGYAQNLLTQANQLKEHYEGSSNTTARFVVSSQHYSFAVSAFIRLVKTFGAEHYDFCLRETRTRDIITDVHNLSADLGIIFLSDYNRRYIIRLLRQEDLQFTPLASFSPHVFISKNNPLATREVVELTDLTSLPFICFEQGKYESDFMSEELLGNPDGTQVIRVSDRATLFNLLLGLNGYTIASGVIESSLNPEIASIPLAAQGNMEIGVIRRNHLEATLLCSKYMEYLSEALSK